MFANVGGVVNSYAVAITDPADEAIIYVEQGTTRNIILTLDSTVQLYISNDHPEYCSASISPVTDATPHTATMTVAANQNAPLNGVAHIYFSTTSGGAPIHALYIHFTPATGGTGAGGTGGAGAGVGGSGSGDANGSGSAGDVPPHVHSYEWKVTQEPTADADVEEIYVCECGDVKYRQGLSAMGAFDRESADKVLKAGYGAIVNIETSHWNSLGRTIKEAMIKRSDVSVKFSFLSEGHKGTRLNLTIPAGYDINSLYDENGFCGLCNAGTILGYDR
ncbi:MAG: hypothetical protein K6A38_08365 [Lachnospiraceae bacterium]|nr:hypothetical protein [Lachnospiraceae bacterium]